MVMMIRSIKTVMVINAWYGNQTTDKDNSDDRNQDDDNLSDDNMTNAVPI